MFAMTSTISGLVLKPLLLFKGTPTEELPTQGSQPSLLTWSTLVSMEMPGWVTRGLCWRWVAQGFKPHVTTAPNGVIQILFLALYRAYMMIVEQTTALDVKIEHIPGGCTGLCVSPQTLVWTNYSNVKFTSCGNNGWLMLAFREPTPHVLHQMDLTSKIWDALQNCHLFWRQESALGSIQIRPSNSVLIGSY